MPVNNRHIALAILIFTLGWIDALGQVASDHGLFSVSFDKACTGSTITIDPLNDDAFWCFNGLNSSDITELRLENEDCFDDNKDGNIRNFTYSEPGSYVILWFLEGVGAQEPLYDSLRIEIYQAVTPTLSYYGCPNGSLVLDAVQEEDPYDQYLIDWGDGVVQTFPKADLPLIHQYPSGNTPFQLSVTGQFNTATGGNNANCGAASSTAVSIIVNDLMLEAAQFTNLQVNSATGIDLNFQLTENIIYSLMQRTGTGNWVKIADLYNQNSFEVSGLSLSNTNYSFQIIIENECTGDVLASEILSPVFLDVPSADQTGNQLNWRVQSGIYTNYQIQASGTNVATVTAIQYLDPNVICGVVYTYQISTQTEGGAIVLSNSQSVEGVKATNQVGISHVSTEVLNNEELMITWENPAAYQPDLYYIYYSFDDRTFFLEDSVSTNSYTARFSTGTERRYFKISYLDRCEGESPQSLSAANILVNTNNLQRNILVSWNPHRAWASGVQYYELEKFDREFNLIERISNITNTNYLDEIINSVHQTIIYKVTAIGQEGRVSISNATQVKLPPQIHFPTAFTPDGDNRNDYFRVFGKFIKEYELFIYSRWGNMVFYTNEISTGWDGDYKSSPAPAGNYIYKVKVIDENNEQHVKEGNFVLIRNR